MKYKNTTDYQHGDTLKVGVLLVNLGTPDAPTKQALKVYLKEFLSDPRVVEPTFPRWIWWLVLNGIILNIRPKKSAEAYATIWDEVGEGSPLMAISKDQKTAISEHFKTQNIEIVTELAMRYGNPSIPHGLAQLKKQNVDRLLVLPLYPQYSAATTASIFDAVTAELQTWRLIPETRFVNHYHDHPGYIEALAESVKKHWQQHSQPDQLVMSFHGVPKRYLINGDPYHCECHKTGRLLAEKLGLSKDQYRVTFQSIFGREEWLKPYTMDTLKALPNEGHKHVQVICPGFAADCLETLEEIAEENMEYFIEAGGNEFSYIPALNSDPSHIILLAEIITTHCGHWLKKDAPNYKLTAKLFKQMDE
ncbi:ferrochelatase [Marinicella sp. S1101]|uniref:ferrochelatase n=1 Tax=Marinicella marina TaxID=2996016 RepID=UPI0022608927|nr:ferrochelatase [Marinicella marina]MCX7554825.1 ferrochelatase [Marinicella marina]MDJ1140942.1 ferrochelatase [Marinicella marina]